jgi:uncharacterized membrane protein
MVSGTGRDEHSTYQILRDATLTGLTVVVPMVVTVWVLVVALDLLLGAFDPLVNALEFAGLTANVSDVLIRLVGVATLAVIIFVTGFVARYRSGQRAIDYFDHVVTAIPGLGAVYDSFRHMGDVMLESDEANFRDVKLLEFPHDGTYTLGFETTHTPERIREAAGESEMETLFLPFAPNPVMGGFLVHVPAERVLDVDMSVEEGLTTVMTTGVATAEPSHEAQGLSQAQLQRLGELGYADFDPAATTEPGKAEGGVDPTDTDEDAV